MAFVTGVALRARARAPLSARAPAMCASPPSPPAAPASAAPLSRRALLSALAGAGAGLGLAAGGAPPARAGLEYGLSKLFFPKEGFTAPQRTVPGTVEVDRAVLGSAEGKAALKTLGDVSVLVKRAGADFEAAPEEFDVAAAFKVVRVDALRDALNVVTPAFDEETQKKTDKVVRGILQDLGELTFNGTIRPGVKRTPKKIDRIRAWISKIDGDLDYLVAFFK